MSLNQRVKQRCCQEDNDLELLILIDPAQQWHVA